MYEPTIVVLAVAIAVHVAIVRPWILAWGATKAERGARYRVSILSPARAP